MGNSTCPFGTNTVHVYSGFAVGGHYSHKGFPANMLCLPPNPRIYVRGSYYVYGIEYQTKGPIINHEWSLHACLVLYVKLQEREQHWWYLPTLHACRKYNRYIIAGHYNQERSSMYNCVDVTLQQIPGSSADNTGHQLYTIYAASSQFTPRYSSYALSCVVCSK